MNEQLERLARMVVLGVAQDELCQIFGLSQTQFETITGTEEYQTVFGKIQLERYSQIDDANDGWNKIETTSLKKVQQHLESFADPDYALRAAIMANKAVRRGNSVGNKPIEVQPNLQTVIQLKVSYVQKVEGGLNVQPRAIENVPQKEVNFMPVKDVKSLLQSDESKLSRELDVALEGLFVTG